MNTKLMAILVIELILFFPLAHAFSITDVVDGPSGPSWQINWSTSVPADSEIQYGKDHSKTLRVNDDSLVYNHSILLQNLEESKIYYYKIVSKDENNTIISHPAEGSAEEDIDFQAPDITPPPKVQNLVLVNATSYTAEIDWDHVEVTDFNRYEIFRDGELIEETTSTSYKDENLLPGMPYEYKVRAVDDDENEGEFSEIILVNTIGEDKTPPVISDVKLSALSQTSATVSWNTDENSNSKVDYGPDENMEEQQTSSDFVKEHSVSITGLVDQWQYYYQVESCDEISNCAKSEVNSFVAGSDYEPPFINASIPQYYNEVGLDFIVETEPFADIKIYVNDIISRSSNAGEDGIIEFDNIPLKSALPTNVVKIEAIDSAGNSNSQDYNVQLDFEEPELVIQTNVSDAIKQGSFSIQGYVNEQSTVSFYIEQEAFDKTPPPKVEDLYLEKVEENLVEFSWNSTKADDVQSYLVYREDIGLIGIASSTLYTDTNVIPGKTYNYWVSALDYDCLEGEYSEQLVVKTSEGTGNQEIGDEIDQVVPECRQKKPVLQVETSGSFNEQITLREGNNKLIIVAEDIYGNSVNVSYDSLYDSQSPQFNSINLGKISPSYNQEVTISGNLSEPCTLEVFVNEEKVNSGETNEKGVFNIDAKLDKGNPKEQGSGDMGWYNQVRVVATDRAGNTAQAEDTIDFLVCGSSNPLFTITPKNLAPSELTPRLLYEGMSQITFELDLDWLGYTEEKKIKGYDVNFLKLSMEQEGNYDSDIIGEPTEILTNGNPGEQSIAVILDINKIDPTNDEKNWSIYEIEKNISKRHSGHCFTHADLMSGGFEGIEGPGCVRVPLEVIIEYESEDYEGNPIIETQKECLFVDVLIQPAVDVAGALPKDLLQDFSDMLGSFIDTIDKVLEPIHTVSKYLLYSCLAMHAVHIISQGAEWFACMDILAKAELGLDTCIECKISEDGNLDCSGNQNCESCLSAKLRTYSVEKAMHLVCDRTQCNSIPSFSTYAFNQEDYSFKSEESACAAFTGEQGTMVDYTASDGTNNPLNYNDETLLSTFGNDPCDICAVLPEAQYCEDNTECCAIQYKEEWDSASLFTNEIKESACMAVNEPGRVKTSPQVKESACGSGISKLFRGVRDFSLCKGEQQVEMFDYQMGLDDWLVMVKIEEEEWDENPEDGEDEKEDIWELALKTRNYNNVNMYNEEEELISQEDGESSAKYIYSPIKTSQKPEDLEGYPTPRDDYIEDRLEEIDDYDYFVEDMYTELSDSESGLKKPTQSVVEYTKSKCTEIVSGEIKLGDNEWPRYVYPDYDEGSQINQRRYVQTDSGYQLKGVDFVEPDLPESFVNFICEGYQPKESHILDPASGLFKAMEAVCIPAIEGYLEQTKLIMETMQGCINQILVTGEGSAGYCQRFLSMYVCDLLYYTLSCVKKAVPSGSGSRGYAPGIAGFGQYMINSIQETKQGIENRYGSTSSMATLLNGKQLFNSACMAMFGADIDFDLDAMIDMGVELPIEPMADISGGTRRFTGINPEGHVSYVYNIFPLLITQQDVNYRIRLVCSDSYTCNPDYGFKNGKCDCAGLGEQSVLLEGGKLEKGDVFGNDPDEELFKEVTSEYRYDTAVLSYDYIIGNEGRVGQQGERVSNSVEKPIALTGGYAPSYCFLRTNPIEFRCNIASDEGARARFIDPVISEEDETIDASSNGYNMIYLGESFIREDINTDIKFDVEQLEENDYGEELPVYLVATLLNNHNEEATSPEQKRINSIGVVSYDEETSPIPFQLKDTYFSQEEGDNCFNGNNFMGCIRSTFPEGLANDVEILKYDTPEPDGQNGFGWDERRDGVLYMRYDGNTWRFYKNIDSSDWEQGKACEVDGNVITCEDEGETGEEIEIQVKLPEDHEVQGGNSITFDTEENTGSAGPQTHKFDLVLEFYNSDKDGDIDMNSPVVYNGITQRLTYEFSVVNGERPECSAETPAVCENQGECTDVGAYWWDDSGECHAEEKEEEEPEPTPASGGGTGSSGTGGQAQEDEESEEQPDLTEVDESYLDDSGNIILNPLAVDGGTEVSKEVILSGIASTSLFNQLKSNEELSFDLPQNFENGAYKISFNHWGNYSFDFGTNVMNTKKFVSSNEKNVPQLENTDKSIILSPGTTISIKSYSDETILGKIKLIKEEPEVKIYNNGKIDEGEICDLNGEGDLKITKDILLGTYTALGNGLVSLKVKSQENPDNCLEFSNLNHEKEINLVCDDETIGKYGGKGAKVKVGSKEIGYLWKSLDTEKFMFTLINDDDEFDLTSGQDKSINFDDINIKYWDDESGNECYFSLPTCIQLDISGGEDCFISWDFREEEWRADDDGDVVCNNDAIEMINGFNWNNPYSLWALDDNANPPVFSKDEDSSYKIYYDDTIFIGFNEAQVCGYQD